MKNKKLECIVSTVGFWYYPSGEMNDDGLSYYGCKIKKLFFGVYKIDYYDSSTQGRLYGFYTYGKKQYNSTVYLFPFGIKEIRFINKL